MDTNLKLEPSRKLRWAFHLRNSSHVMNWHEILKPDFELDYFY
jgi:hypothetical protein